MIDLAHVVGAVLASPWLLPLLTLAVTMDGPFPFLPSEPILFSAVGTAFAHGDVLRIASLFVAALLGSLLGDALLYWVGRSSHRIIRTAHRDEGLGAWVRRHMHRRPVLALAAVRLIPGGRLAAVTAAGRVRLPVRAFVPATVTASLVWCTYMTGVGLVIGPITHGNPILSLLAGLVSGTLIGSVVECARRVLRARARWSGTDEDADRTDTGSWCPAVGDPPHTDVTSMARTGRLNR